MGASENSEWVGPVQYVWVFEVVYFRNGRFYFQVNNCKEVEKDGVNYFYYFTELNCRSKRKKHKRLWFYLSIKDKK